MMGRFSDEAKSAVRYLSLKTICREDGVDINLCQSKNSYGNDNKEELDGDLASFLDYKWTWNMSADQFIAGFDAHFDKVSSLNTEAELKGHTLLRQACLFLKDGNMVSASGSYDVTCITLANHNAFKGRTLYDYSLFMPSPSPGVLQTTPNTRGKPQVQTENTDGVKRH